MKTSYLPLLFSLLAIFIVAGCQQDDDFTTKRTLPGNMTQEQLDAYNAKMLLVPEQTELQITSRVPISYIATLNNGSYFYAHAFENDQANVATHDYFKFYAGAGSNVTIQVNRIDCTMDPAFWHYTGTYTDTDNLAGGTFSDDELPPACPGPFGDPHEFIPGASGWYTVGVADFLDSGSPPFEYEITIAGLNNLIVAGCPTQVGNGQHNASTTMQQAIDNCLANNAANCAGWVACVTALTNTWVSQGKITRAQKSQIVTCALNNGPCD